MESIKKKMKMLGTELLMDTKKKVHLIQTQNEQQIATLEKSWNKRLEEKMSELQKKSDIEINHLERKSLADIQLKEQIALLQLKNSLFEEVKKAVSELVSTKVTANYPEYIEYLIQNIVNGIDLLEQKSKLYLNERDHQYFTKKGFPKTRYPISLAEKGPGISGGFVLESEDKSKRVEFSLDEILQKNAIILTKIFNQAIQEDLK